MHVRKNEKQAAFTIVELLIVVVVIGILAAITIVAYSGMQTRADNTARQNEAIAWRKSFEVYKATYGSYPVMPDGGYCLGSGSQNGYCRVYQGGSYQYAESNDAPP